MNGWNFIRSLVTLKLRRSLFVRCKYTSSKVLWSSAIFNKPFRQGYFTSKDNLKEIFENNIENDAENSEKTEQIEDEEENEEEDDDVTFDDLLKAAEEEDKKKKTKE